MSRIAKGTGRAIVAALPMVLFTGQAFAGITKPEPDFAGTAGITVKF